MTTDDNGKVKMSEIPVELTAGMRSQQVRFAWEMAWSDNRTQSAINAGYSEASAHSRGSRLAKLDKVDRIVQWLRERVADMVEVDVQYVISNLQTVIQEGMKPIPVMAPGGRETGYVRMADAPSAVRSLELLGRYQRMWEGEIKQETNVVVGVQHAGDTMTQERWEDMVSKYAKPATAHSHESSQ